MFLRLKRQPEEHRLAEARAERADDRIPIPIADRRACVVSQSQVYPVTNYAFDTQSYKENQTTQPLSSEGMKCFFKHYLENPADGNNPRISVLRSDDLKGLPPATIINAAIDPLLDDGEQYAAKLKAAGVPVTHKLYKGVTHEFFGTGAVVDEGREAMNFAAQQLQSAFAKGTASSASAGAR